MIKKLLKKEYLWIILMVIAVYIGSYYGVIYRMRNGIEGRMYLGFIASPFDTIGNLTSVQRGYAGNWTKYSYITSVIPSERLYWRLEYMSIGHIARILGINPVSMFKIATLVLSGIYLVLIYRFISALFPSPLIRMIGFFLCLFSTGVIIPGIHKGWIVVRSDMQVFQRTTALQIHYLLAAITTLISIMGLSKSIFDKKPAGFIISCIAGFVCAYVFTPASIVLISSLFPFAIYLIFSVKLKKDLLRIFGLLFVYAVFSIVPVIYLFLNRNKYDLNIFTLSEYLLKSNIDALSYILFVGPVMITALLALPLVLKQGNRLMVLIASYVLVHPFCTLVLAPILKVNPMRFIQTPYFIMYAVLSTLWFEKLYLKLRKITTKLVALGLSVFLVLIIIIPSISTYKLSLNYFSEMHDWDFFDLGYPYQDEMKVIQYLASIDRKEDVVLSDVMAGTILQAYSTKKAVATWFVINFLPSDTSANILNPIRIFYKQEMSNDQAREFLKNNSISYVLFTEIEWSHLFYATGKTELSYPFLVPLFRSGKDILYKVNL